MQDIQDVSVDITPEARHPISRLCLAQKRHGGADMDIWLLDALKILPVLPSNSSKYIQFSLNLQCGSTNENNRYPSLFYQGILIRNACGFSTAVLSTNVQKAKSGNSQNDLFSYVIIMDI